MYRLIIFMGCSFSFLCSVSLFAQVQNPVSAFPLDPSRSVLFGKDVIISDEADQNQRNIAISSAANGWLYACFWHPITTGGYKYYIVRSIDGGISWEEIYSLASTSSPDTYIRDKEILAVGDNPTNIKVFIAYVRAFGYFKDKGVVGRLNGLTGEIEAEILQDQDFSWIHDIAIATDYPYPAVGADPFSIAILHTKHQKYTDYEKLVFCTSSNGGMSIDHREEILVTTEKTFYHVDLSYARSPAQNTGFYYGIWEEKEYLHYPYGHIYTAHTESGFDDSFTAPVCLDSLNAANINNCRNPKIACQADNVDNDSLDITQLVLFETNGSGSNGIDLAGYYNKKSTSTNTFSDFSFTDTANINIQGDIEYNPYTHKFLITYFDSTILKLPLVSNGFNIPDPYNWAVESPGYNDEENLGFVNPQLKLSYSDESAIMVWRSLRGNENGSGLFDAQNSTYTMIHNENGVGEQSIIPVYPNPCSKMLNIRVMVEKAQEVDISIISNLGLTLQYESGIPCIRGSNILTIDISSFQPGCYIVLVKTRTGSFCNKIIVSTY